MRILLVEDDKQLGAGLEAGLQQAGFQVDWVCDGQAAELAVQTEPFTAVVLDLGLPKIPGLDLLKRWRERHHTLPVLVLTARDTAQDTILGLDAGADDYVIKPCDLGEIAARLRALIRRSAGRAAPELVHGPLILDPAARQVRYQKADVELSPREFDLLHELLLHCGRVLTRPQLEARLYPWGEAVESNAIEVHIHHLRKKLSPTLIQTVRGVGYLIPKLA